MTEPLEPAIACIPTLPEAIHDDRPAMLLLFAGEADGPVFQLTPEEEADLAASDAEVSRGEFATDEQIRAVWAKQGP